VLAEKACVHLRRPDLVRRERRREREQREGD
jgi:hypothetical protein